MRGKGAARLRTGFYFGLTALTQLLASCAGRSVSHGNDTDVAGSPEENQGTGGSELGGGGTRPASAGTGAVSVTGGATGAAGAGGGITGAAGVNGVGGLCGVSPCEFTAEYENVHSRSFTPNRAPVACRLPPEEQPSWLCNSALCTQINGSFQQAASCVDEGFGLSSEGRITNPRGPADLALRSHAGFGAQVECPDAVSVPLPSCSLGGMVGVQEECGDVPEGAGGEIVPGAYALTEFVAYGTTAFPKPGSAAWQTLYLTESSALLLSFDFNNFDFAGTYTVERDGNTIAFRPFCETQSPMYRAFPEKATYSSDGTSLELFDQVRRVRVRFDLVP